MTEKGEAIEKAQIKPLKDTVMEEKWYAVYTKPRWEKRVSETLLKNEFNAYCPLNRVVRQWSDRKKVVHTPLFTSYVFVRITEKQISEIKQTEGVINLVYWLGKPAIVKDEEIELIRDFLKEYQDVQLEKTHFKLHGKVRVTSGHLMNKEGTVVAIKNNTIKVALPSLHYIMCAEVAKANAIRVDHLEV